MGMADREDRAMEFARWDSFSRFARHVRFNGRYVRGDEERAFLETVLATIHDRDVHFKEGRTFYRAQLGVNFLDQKDEDGNWTGEEIVGFGAERMKPLTDRAREGRANPTGIPALYVGTTIETAISEVRPWIGADVSLAWCRLVKPMRTLDLTQGHGRTSFAGPVFRHVMGGPDLTPAEKEEAVWVDIDNAFSEPVTSTDDRADYAPTQILAELFRSAGYDAIGYKSHFGDDGEKRGFNIAIFDSDAVEIVACAPYRVASIKIEARQNGNAWSKASD
jgi:hypothetical protein